MPGIVPVTRLAETIVGIQISGPDDMLTVLTAATSFGYQGGIDSYIDPTTQSETYRLRLNNQAQGDQFALVGDWVTLWNNSKVTCMTCTDFDAKYTYTGLKTGDASFATNLTTHEG